MPDRVTARPYRTDDDFRLIRELLISTYPITPTGFNWEIRRWDGWMFHREQPRPVSRLAELVHLWLNETGLAIGAIHPEGSGDAHIQIHPDYRHLESDMIDRALTRLALSGEGNRRRLDVFAFEYDTLRVELLQSRGFVKTSEVLVTRRLRFGSRSWPGPEPVPGYTIRTSRPDEKDYRRVAEVINAGFGRTSHTGAEIRAFMTRSPSFRHDLDLVAEAADGSFAAYVGFTFDDLNRRGIVEPVCTHPDHLRRGLARNLIRAGLGKLRLLGATDVYVDTGEMTPANRLYESVGFAEAYAAHAWRKVI